MPRHRCRSVNSTVRRTRARTSMAPGCTGVGMAASAARAATANGYESIRLRRDGNLCDGTVRQQDDCCGDGDANARVLRESIATVAPCCQPDTISSSRHRCRFLLDRRAPPIALDEPIDEQVLSMARTRGIATGQGDFVHGAAAGPMRLRPDGAGPRPVRGSSARSISALSSAPTSRASPDR